MWSKLHQAKWIKVVVPETRTELTCITSIHSWIQIQCTWIILHQGGLAKTTIYNNYFYVLTCNFIHVPAIIYKQMNYSIVFPNGGKLMHSEQLIAQQLMNKEASSVNNNSRPWNHAYAGNLEEYIMRTFKTTRCCHW